MSRGLYPVYILPVRRICSLLLLVLPVLLAGPAAAARGSGTLFGSVTLVDANGQPLADQLNAVVFVDGLTAVGGAASTPPRVSHRGKKFSPRVLPIASGSQVDFLNDDSIFHNVFSLSKAKPFDLGIYPEGTSKLVTFDRPGLVKIYCNIHPKMVSNILVLNNSYFALTDNQGQFRIDNVPEGDFTLRVWHELATAQQRQISLSKGQLKEVHFSVSATHKLKQHKNKFGKRYPEKY